jgi:hypothetical protein
MYVLNRDGKCECPFYLPANFTTHLVFFLQMRLDQETFVLTLPS